MKDPSLSRNVPYWLTDTTYPYILTDKCWERRSIHAHTSHTCNVSWKCNTLENVYMKSVSYNGLAVETYTDVHGLRVNVFRIRGKWNKYGDVGRRINTVMM